MLIKNINLSNITKEQGFSIYGAKSQDYSGYSSSWLGDVNGDKIDDLIIGSPQDSSSQIGIAYIIFGNKSEFNNYIDLSNITLTQGFSIYNSKATKPSEFNKYYKLNPDHIVKLNSANKVNNTWIIS